MMGALIGVLLAWALWESGYLPTPRRKPQAPVGPRDTEALTNGLFAVGILVFGGGAVLVLFGVIAWLVFRSAGG